MGMAAEDHIDARDPGGHLEVNVHAVVGDHHHHIRFLVLTHRIDHRLHVVITNAEGPVRHETLGIGDRRVRKGLTDHGHPGAADGFDHIGLEGGACILIETGEIGKTVVEQGVILDFDVLGHEVALEIRDVGDHLLVPIGELPVAGHHIHTQQVTGPDHVLAAGPVGSAGTLPGITTVQQQAVARSPIVTQPLHQGLQMSETSDLAIFAGCRIEIEIAEGMGLDRSWTDAEMFQQFAADQMGRLVEGVSQAQIDVGLAKIDRDSTGHDCL